MEREGLEDTVVGGNDGQTMAGESALQSDGSEPKASATVSEAASSLDATTSLAPEARPARGAAAAGDVTAVLSGDDLDDAAGTADTATDVPALDIGDDRYSDEAYANELYAGIEDSADAQGPYEDAEEEEVSFPRRIVLWGSWHQGAAVALATLVALVVIIGGFALGAHVLLARVDADIAARSAELTDTDESESVSTLPLVSIRFTSLDTSIFPVVTAQLVFSTSDGTEVPALTSDQLTLTETDEDGASATPSITGFNLDQSTGVCQIAYVADSTQLAESRTLEILLAEESGYRGGASMGYTVTLSDEESDDDDADQAEWILPDSDTHRYTASELADLSDDELFIARNEIFARHGRMFGSSYLQDYFESKSWYEPRYTADEFDSMQSPLNDIEKANVNTILEVEQSG